MKRDDLLFSIIEREHLRQQRGKLCDRAAPPDGRQARIV